MMKTIQNAINTSCLAMTQLKQYRNKHNLLEYSISLHIKIEQSVHSTIITNPPHHTIHYITLQLSHMPNQPNQHCHRENEKYCQLYITIPDVVVRDHCHITGIFRGAAHQKCNLNYRMDSRCWRLPIFFHNLRGYTGHLLFKA